MRSPPAGPHRGAHPGRPAWKGMSAKLWLSWAMIRSTSAYGWASRAKPWCWALWRCCQGVRGGTRHYTQGRVPADPQPLQGETGQERLLSTVRGATARWEGAHPMQLLKGLLATLTVPFLPSGHGAGGGSQAWLSVLELSGEGTEWGKWSLLGPLERNCCSRAWSPDQRRDQNGHGAGQAQAGLSALGTKEDETSPRAPCPSSVLSTHTSQTTGENGWWWVVARIL